MSKYPTLGKVIKNKIKLRKELIKNPLSKKPIKVAAMSIYGSIKSEFITLNNITFGFKPLTPNDND